MRIIAGSRRGKIIHAPEGMTTRPTSDRARETLFNILNSLLLKAGRTWDSVTFIDVFAGSGAVGIEALSRGAKHVTCIENHPAAVACLKRNCAGLDNITVDMCDALAPARGVAADIVFMDAPYGKGLWQKSLAAFVKAGRIDDRTLVIIETDGKLRESLPEGFHPLRERSAGRNTFLFAIKGKNT